ncbi:MAG: alginate export family protein [Vicinamibacterales bacterium]|nr:alginate export family protein [Vicinamibacterales bacterium]
MRVRFALILAAGLLMWTSASVGAQTTEESSTGLPPAVDWKFNFDATWGTFGFANSLFQNPKEGVHENLTDQWFEGSIKPALSGSYKLASSSEFFGKVSAVGERTYGSSPVEFGGDVSSFQVDDLSFGWRSGNVLNFEVGRTPYELAHGMLLWDGAAEGGSRGGYWTNARKAFEFATIGRVNSGHHRIEGFYLDKDELQESDSGTRLGGANYEYALGEHSTFGATYMRFFANQAVKPDRDGMNVFNLRAYTAPLPKVPDLSFEFEYASERNGDLISSNAWTLQGGYELSTVSWKPTFAYRYAFFQGDDPATIRNENFDALLTGMYDWGYWWQGEIVGEYIGQNSNLISNLVRAHFAPAESVGAGLMFYGFRLDHPSSLAEGVTSDNLAQEFDAYIDWKINPHFTASFVGAFANPGAAVRQAFDRTKNFSYGMVFLAYRY